MIKTNNWLTAKGSKIILTTQDITSEVIDLDGHKATVNCDRIDIVKCTVDGNEQRVSLHHYQGKNVLHMGYKTIDGTKHPLMILIPDDVYEDIWGNYNRRFAAELKAQLKADESYQDNYNKILKAMEE